MTDNPASTLSTTGTVYVASSPIGCQDLGRARTRGALPDRVAAVDPGRVPTDSPVQVLWRSGNPTLEWFYDCLARLPDLAWVHSDYTGMDDLPLAELAARGITVTNAVGGYARPIAEWIVLTMLAGNKELSHFTRQSMAGVWDPSPVPRELEGQRIMLLGLGSIGTELARLLLPFEPEITALARHSRTAPPPGVKRVVTGEDWFEYLPSTDYLVVTLPLTARTRGLVNARVLATLPPTARLINVSRGAVVDEPALIRSLDSGRLAGAVLDTHTVEPLPAGHPLWGRDNVLVLPHRTWLSPRTRNRVTDLFSRQLNRWLASEALGNVVDPVEGY